MYTVKLSTVYIANIFNKIKLQYIDAYSQISGGEGQEERGADSDGPQITTNQLKVSISTPEIWEKQML